MRASFRPEFINRVDEFVVFEGLRLEQIRQIVRLQAKRVEARLEDQKIHLQLTDDAVDYLAVRAPCLLLTFSPLCGAAWRALSSGTCRERRLETLRMLLLVSLAACPGFTCLGSD